MNKLATIKIELSYTLEDLRFMLGRDITEDDFEQEVIEQALYDLRDLLHTQDLSAYSEMEITDAE